MPFERNMMPAVLAGYDLRRTTSGGKPAYNLHHHDRWCATYPSLAQARRGVLWRLLTPPQQRLIGTDIMDRLCWNGWPVRPMFTAPRVEDWVNVGSPGAPLNLRQVFMGKTHGRSVATVAEGFEPAGTDPCWLLRPIPGAQALPYAGGAEQERLLHLVNGFSNLFVALPTSPGWTNRLIGDDCRTEVETASTWWELAVRVLVRNGLPVTASGRTGTVRWEYDSEEYYPVRVWVDRYPPSRNRLGPQPGDIFVHEAPNGAVLRPGAPPLGTALSMQCLAFRAVTS